MGEIAEMMLDGTLDSVTGEYLGPGPGYPRTREQQDGPKKRTAAQRLARSRRRARQRARAKVAKEDGNDR